MLCVTPGSFSGTEQSYARLSLPGTLDAQIISSGPFAPFRFCLHGSEDVSPSSAIDICLGEILSPCLSTFVRLDSWTNGPGLCRFQHYFLCWHCHYPFQSMGDFHHCDGDGLYGSCQFEKDLR